MTDFDTGLDDAAQPRVDEASEARSRRTPKGPPKRSGSVLGRVRYGLNFLLDPIGFVGGRFARYGDVYFVGAEHDAGLFVLRHPEHIEQVLVTKARSFEKKHSAFELLSKVLGHGLLTSDGEVWRRQRRLVQPAFKTKRLEGYADAMVEEALFEADRWADGETRDTAVDMTELTLRIVTRTLFGTASSPEDADAVRRSMDEFQRSLLGLNLPIPDWASPSYWRLRRATKTLDEIIYRFLRERRERGAPEGPKDLLQMLVDARDDEGDGRGLSDEEIRDQLITLFLAGHETTANALSWTFHLLGDNPEVEAKLHAELDQVLAGRPPTYEDLARLPYTEQVFLESMRMYPPVYMVARLAVEDVEIGGFLVPKGSELVIWIWHTHHDARWFEEPWTMRPERFEAAAVAARPRTAYLPFAHGPRACVGKRFALIEGQLALATLASRYRLVPEPGHPVELKPRITLSPSHGLKMTVHAR